MANEEHVALVKGDPSAWFKWQKENPHTRLDLCEADLSNTDLSEIDLSEANFDGANLQETKLEKTLLYHAQLRKANLYRANLVQADLTEADLHGANLVGANLSKAKLHNTFLYEALLNGANLHNASLSDANLRGADLSNTELGFADLSFADLGRAKLCNARLSNTYLVNAHLVETNLRGAELRDCCVYGISAWELKLDKTIQTNLIITRPSDPAITVDNLEVAQFIYLLLHNEKIRDVINTITTKVVLILGRFGEHKSILDAIRDAIRKYNYSPVLFDFDKPLTRDFTETVSTLAHLARFIIADITSPSSIPQELQAIVPTLAVPIQPLLAGSEKDYSMFSDLSKKYHWVLPIHKYNDLNDLLVSLPGGVIAPAEAKARELEKR